MSQADALFGDLLTIRRYRSSGKLTTMERWFQGSSRKFLAVGLASLAVLLVIAVVRFFVGPLPPWLVTVALLMAIFSTLAAYGFLLSDAVVSLLQVAHRRVREHHDRGSFKHDEEIAARIATYPKPVVSQVDAWFEEQSGGMGRRVSLFMGKDVAILGLAITLLTGKANDAFTALVGFLAPSFRTSPTHVAQGLILALALMIIGAFGVKAREGRYTYIRYLIRVSDSLRDLDEGNNGAAPTAAPSPELPEASTVAALVNHRKVTSTLGSV